MKKIKEQLKFIFTYTVTFLKWLVVATLVGAVGGAVGSVFHISIDYVSEMREHNSFLLYLLPIGGVIITAMYAVFGKKGKIDTNRVIASVRKNKEVPLVMVPLIFVSTVITHMLGGSAGREGAALQIGGGIGYNLGKLLRLSEKHSHIIIMAGMSSVFAALFGTPITAAVFSLEVTSVGVLHYAGLFPCIISSVVAYRIALAFGVSPVRFDGVTFEAFSAPVALKVIVLALLCALLSIAFCVSIEKCEKWSHKLLKNKYLRAFVCGLIVLALTLALGTTDYNGAGMSVITRAISGSANYEAFILKIVFTAITISAGFKGGEIVPAFFVGSTFGCCMGALLGINPGFAAALGFVALFCGVVNCPIASIILSLEVFSVEGILFFAIVCSVSYMMSGYFGLYKSQKIVYSKLDDEFINVNTN